MIRLMAIIISAADNITKAIVVVFFIMKKQGVSAPPAIAPERSVYGETTYGV